MASFHLMQIEQVIGGVDGDTTAQAVQLRMRGAGQGDISVARIRAWDATGANPVVVVDFAADVVNDSIGDRILIASTKFKQLYPSLNADFTMASLIPSGYLPAGRLTFEDDSGVVYWSLAWGGAGYTGSTTGSFDNDNDGDYGPPFAGALPSTTQQALLFGGAATAVSTSNSTQYAVTAGPAVFRNNARQAVSLSTTPAVLVYQGVATLTATTPAANTLSRPGKAFLVLDTGSSTIRLVQTFRGRSGQHQISFVDGVLQSISTKAAKLVTYFRAESDGTLGTAGYTASFDNFSGFLRPLRVSSTSTVSGPISLIGTIERRDSTPSEEFSLHSRISVRYSGNRTQAANNGGISADDVFQAIKNQLTSQGFTEVTALD